MFPVDEKKRRRKEHKQVGVEKESDSRNLFPHQPHRRVLSELRTKAISSTTSGSVGSDEGGETGGSMGNCHARALATM